MRRVLAVAVLCACSSSQPTSCPLPRAQAAGTYCATPWFPGRLSIVPHGSGQIALGDLDGDGTIDVVTPTTDAKLTVMFGRGDAFVSGVSYPTLAKTSHPIVADLDGNGSLDVAMLDANGVEVLINHGDGTFAAAVGDPVTGATALAIGNHGELLVATTGNTIVHLTYHLGAFAPGMTTTNVAQPPAWPIAIAAGDIVATVNSDQTITVGASRFALSTAASDVALADIDGDGDLDVVTATGVLVNTAGTFTLEPVASGAGGQIVAGDLDHDGQADLVIAGTTVMMHRGAGFAAPVTHQFSTTTTSLALADLDRDGVLDLVVAGDTTITPWFGRGDGTFVEPTDVEPDALVVEDDVDHDGATDLVTISSAGLGVRLGHGDGTFDPVAVTPLLALDAAIADFDRDGVDDVAIVGSMIGEPGTLTILLGANGSFAQRQAITTGLGTTEVVSGDLNGDCIPDLVVANFGHHDAPANIHIPGMLQILLGNGDGTFAITSEMSWLSNLVLADIDDDGVLDLVADDPNGAHVLLGAGDGTFLPDHIVGASGFRAVADVDRDHRLDLVGTSGVMLGVGDGMFAAAIPNGGSAPLADIDGDGNLDLVGGGAIAYGHGDGTFADPIAYFHDDANSSVGDLDGDGLADLAGSHLLVQRCRP